MIVVISSSKTIGFDFETPPKLNTSEIKFHEEAKKLVQILKSKNTSELSSLLETSMALAQKSYEYNNNWQFPFNENARAAAFSFQGTVYDGLDIQSLSIKEIEYLQSHLRILSAVYGILLPLDLMLPVRLEMANKISGKGFKNLYDFWKTKITNTLKEELQNCEQKTIINLASNEYFKSIDTNKLKARIITPEFKDFKNGRYKTLVVYTKRARGLMVRFMALNALTNCDDLKLFEEEGYYYNHNQSSENNWIFTRG